MQPALRRLLFACLLSWGSLACLSAEPAPVPPTPAPRTPAPPPVIGAWFWEDDTLAPDGYKPFLDAVAAHSVYTLLSVSLRVSKGELTAPAIRQHIGDAVRYADRLGVKIAFDVDPRLARQTFLARHPDEAQQELVLHFAEAAAGRPTEFVFEGPDPVDHMTGGTIPYRCLQTRLVRVYAFDRGNGGIEPASLHEIPAEACRTTSDAPNRLRLEVPAGSGPQLCAIVAHTYLTPDVFAPHLLAFQRELIRLYSDLPLAGVMKDEWGFPPDHTGNPAHDRYWFSPALAQAYAGASAGRELVHDALLMTAGIRGQETERQAAINRYRQLGRERCAAIEEDFYRAGKATFGPAAAIVTHPTWTPYPGAAEFRKNGLDWWDATRDIGQSDENTPFSCRTSLAKRWGSPLWYNQYYSSHPEDYGGQLWSAALAGGRLNFHPLYPPPGGLTGAATHLALLRGRLQTGLARLRMLDHVVRAPLDSPVAVIFGHAAAMNWAGASYDRVGLEIASALNRAGYPTDLIPSSLIATGALRLDADGRICLGPQRYRAVVLFQPEFAGARELAFFTRAARGPSPLFVVGEWHHDGDGRPLDGLDEFRPLGRHCGTEPECAAAVQRYLEESGVAAVTPWSAELPAWDRPGASAAPPPQGFSRLTDGTCVRIAGARDPAGDPIQETFTWENHAVTVDAIGLVALRFASDGRLDAFAAGGLKRVRIDGFELELPQRTDLAFVTDPDGRIHGVFNGTADAVPAALRRVTTDWTALAVPPPLL